MAGTGGLGGWSSCGKGPWNDRPAGWAWGHHLPRRLSTVRSDARLLVKPSRAVAAAAPPPCCGSDGFHLCSVIALELLGKARSLAVDTRSCRRIDGSDCSWRNERDFVGPCLAAADASARCRGVLDPACTCLGRHTLCRPASWRSTCSKDEKRDHLGSRFQSTTSIGSRLT